MVSEIDPVTEQVASAGRGDVASLTDTMVAAYDAHASAVYGIALRTTRDRDLAADVTQEAFLRLLLEARAGRFPDNVGGWLYRTSSNLIISRARRTSVARRLAPRLVVREAPAGPEAIALDNEQHRALEASLATLSLADRMALVMSAQGCSGAEIAAHLGRTHGATRTHLTRARGRLRAAILEREASR